ncbi:MAG: creatininase family protein [Armatimonadota bacterium]|nr:creatininase family protein [Armatimonadota bacterium]MDR7485249.1 creatininase family protein [Armatimonadota bacterium]MDR7534209.1 creatininase family protein [Armatimonadota bacterium]MDR7537124.1 creatininase family protein [Armatimonadota bacterium]
MPETDHPGGTVVAPPAETVHLAELTWEEVRGAAARDAVIVLPTGSIEQHGPHLPVKTDTLLVTAVTAEAVRRAAARVPVYLAPTLWLGLSTHHAAFFSLTVTFDTYQRVLVELAESLIRVGFQRLLFVNGHGGNSDPLRLAVTRLRDRHRVLVATVDYWDVARDEFDRIRDSGPGGMGHACEWETSGVWHLEPHLVRRDRIAAEYPPTIPGWFAIDMTMPGGPVKVGTRFEDLTRRGVVGDPTLASPEKGRRFFEAAVERLTELLVSFADWQLIAGLGARAGSGGAQVPAADESPRTL